MQHSVFQLKNPKKLYSYANDCRAFTLPCSWSHQARNARVEGYYIRLYYEFLYCRSCGGQVFFVTFTYNNRSLHYMHGYPVPDKRDMQYLLNHSQFARQLKKRGFDFKYFTAVELGEGKGKRGLHNNPHFHVLFYLYPNRKTPALGSLEFLQLCQRYWQGTDEEGNLLHYKEAKFGQVSYSTKGSEVLDFRAVSYVSKYVVKDQFLEQRDRDVIKAIKDFWMAPFRMPYCIKWYPCVEHLEYTILLKHGLPARNPLLFPYLPSVRQTIQYIQKCQDQIREYRNFMSTKCFYSQGLGLSALNYVGDDGKVELPGKSLVRRLTLPLYLFRKLYYDVKKSLVVNCRVVNGKRHYYQNNIYVLNKAGVERKYQVLRQKYDIYMQRLRNLVPQLSNIDWTDSLKVSLNSIGVDLSSLRSFMQDKVNLHKLSLYNLLYKGHNFCKWLPDLNFESDFYRFNISIELPTSFDNSLCTFTDYSYHSEFASIIPFADMVSSIFEYFDSLRDTALLINDAEHRRQARLGKQTKTFYKL